MFYGDPSQFLYQLLTVGVAIVFSAVGTFIIYKVVDALVGMRVEKREEYIGLDLSHHHETGYTLMD